MIYQVLTYARAYDAAFAGDALPDAEVAALRKIWTEVPGVTSALPIKRWTEIEAEVARLARDEADDLSEDWFSLARQAENLHDHPLAAAVALTYALAALESVSKRDFYWSLADGARPEWHPLGLVYAEILIKLKAIWAADLFLRRTLDTIQATNRYRHDREKDIVARADRCRALLFEAHELRRGAVQGLLSELVNGHRDVSGGLSALLWTLGYPVDAEAVARGDSPSRWVVESLIDDSLRRGDWDPFTQDTWTALDDRYGVGLSRHAMLKGKLTQRVGLTLTRRIDLGSDPPVSRTYARVAVAHFEGELDGPMRNQLAFICENWIPVLMPMQSSDAVRLLALEALAVQPRADRTARMAELARMAVGLVERARVLGVNDYYDHSFDNIFGNLAVDPEEQLERTLDLIELYRASGLAHWLTVTRPELPKETAAQNLLEKEEALIEEFRGARFIRLSSDLPRHYQKYSINADHWESFGNPFDQERAASRLLEIADELKGIWAELDEIAPNYAKERRTPTPSLDEFAELLTPTDVHDFDGEFAQS